MTTLAAMSQALSSCGAVLARSHVAPRLSDFRRTRSPRCQPDPHLTQDRSAVSMRVVQRGGHHQCLRPLADIQEVTRFSERV